MEHVNKGLGERKKKEENTDSEHISEQLGNILEGNRSIGRVTAENDIGGLTVQSFSRSNRVLDQVCHFLDDRPNSRRGSFCLRHAG